MPLKTIAYTLAVLSGVACLFNLTMSQPNPAICYGILGILAANLANVRMDAAKK